MLVLLRIHLNDEPTTTLIMREAEVGYKYATIQNHLASPRISTVGIAEIPLFSTIIILTNHDISKGLLLAAVSVESVFSDWF